MCACMVPVLSANIESLCHHANYQNFFYKYVIMDVKFDPTVVSVLLVAFSQAGRDVREDIVRYYLGNLSDDEKQCVMH